MLLIFAGPARHNFIHCGSGKRVYMFPNGSKLADAGKEVAS